MKWSNVNTKLVQIGNSSKTISVRAIRPFEAMPRWFKRWVKRLNTLHDLAANLALKPRRRNGRRKAVAVA